MAEIIWTEPALSDLEDIADYIALDKPDAASALAVRVFATVDRLMDFPNSGRVVPELEGFSYREVIVNPCRVIYRHEADKVYVLHVVRQERKIRLSLIQKPD